MIIQLFGSGCSSCQKLHATIQEVVQEMKLEVEVEYFVDVAKLAELGVMSSPVFVIDGDIISSDNLPLKKEIEQAIQERLKGKTKKDIEFHGNCSCSENE